MTFSIAQQATQLWMPPAAMMGASHAMSMGGFGGEGSSLSSNPTGWHSLGSEGAARKITSLSTSTMRMNAMASGFH
eukprot:CAMPEP_0114542512 /NCGR_PEP_ID=MMETSP0114-20121206/1874_1 /TAXON_ID=31324 /ORGANISM="Goniomonas sp, Strain m" /LENGTH=75 /DNA_ID=CAMNT_0001726813 /DNA_START=19 /DNA_END=246 /DNA_ORIENTATION=+